MKRRFAFLPVVFLFMTCCKQEEKPAPSGVIYPVYSGTATGLRNGHDWLGYIVVGAKNEKITLTILRFNKDSVLKEGLVFDNVPVYAFRDTIQLIEIDTIEHRIANTGIYCRYALNDDWDLTTPPLDMILSKEHLFEVTQYNAETKELKGKFSVSYFNTYLNMDKDSIITFENIEFSAKILE